MFVFIQDGRLKKYLSISQAQTWQRNQNTNTVGNAIRALFPQERSKGFVQEHALSKEEKQLLEDVMNSRYGSIDTLDSVTVTGGTTVYVSLAEKPFRLKNSMQDITGQPVSIRRSDLMKEMSMLSAHMDATNSDLETLQNMVTGLRKGLAERRSESLLKSVRILLIGLYRNLKDLLRFIKRNVYRS